MQPEQQRQGHTRLRQDLLRRLERREELYLITLGASRLEGARKLCIRKFGPAPTLLSSHPFALHSSSDERALGQQNHRASRVTEALILFGTRTMIRAYSSIQRSREGYGCKYLTQKRSAGNSAHDEHFIWHVV